MSYVIIAFDNNEGTRRVWLDDWDMTEQPFTTRDAAQKYADAIMAESPHWVLTVAELVNPPKLKGKR